MKTSEQLYENVVRQLAAQRGYRVSKSRQRLFVKTKGQFTLWKGDQPVVITEGDRSPSLDELEAYLRALPVGPDNRVYPSRPRGAERISHA